MKQHLSRKWPYFARKRRFPAKTAPRPTVAEFERVCRENHDLRERLADVRCMVFDFPIYRTHVSQYVKLVVLLRGLVKS